MRTAIINAMITNDLTPRLKTHSLGFPRIGRDRELKKAVEGYWSGGLTRTALLETARDLRAAHWKLQRDAGIALVPSNDFSLYDAMLDHACLLGCAPARYLAHGRVANLDEYFAMARGGTLPDGRPARALEMTKWLDTNYHYLVPELEEDQEFQLASSKPFDEFREALGLGLVTKPVLIGPVTFLKLAKSAGKPFDTLALLPRLLPVYAVILRELQRLGAEWVQLDEPVLATDLTDAERDAVTRAYDVLGDAAPGLSLLVASYFGRYAENLPTALNLNVRGIHLDAFRAGEELDAVLAGLPDGKVLSLGIVEGRNIWKNDFAVSLTLIRRARRALGDARLLLAPSSSLLHVPVSLAPENALPEGLRDWLSFAEEKLAEVNALARLALLDAPENDPEYRANQASVRARRAHPGTRAEAVRQRLAAIRERDVERSSPFERRAVAQRERLNLPAYPSTTIGSFPQTDAVRRARARFKRGEIDAAAYRAFLEQETIAALRIQEDLGLDLLVHGEFERTDMVEFFGEKLAGFAFTGSGWVQSYGSRCVKPPVLWGDVSRPEPMTLDWATFAARNTKLPVKGMLTGPVTILKWSFVRDDQPLADSANQIALALRDEVIDLEAAGVAAIQIDEPALREALPLRAREWKEALDWEVRAFRLAASGVGDETQIHTHMCYCDFGEVMESIAALDADVISLEASRSGMELLESFRAFDYPNAVGPGLWDIHSPRVPSAEEMTELLRRARKVVDPSRLWVNPDCGLKTRGWKEVEPALRNMVAAAKALRLE
jgi:5-methyltetrahydropteroyltriglutamate--homocysteine methyltransferase